MVQNSIASSSMTQGGRGNDCLEIGPEERKIHIIVETPAKGKDV